MAESKQVSATSLKKGSSVIIDGVACTVRDIKTSNIFLTASGNLKIGDFGISKILDNSNIKAMTLVGTPYYLSPEVCLGNLHYSCFGDNQIEIPIGKTYDFKSDLWALGCVLYEMAAHKVFQFMNDCGLQEIIHN